MAKTLYFTNAAATTHRGDNTAKLAGATSWWQPFALSETRGAAAATATAASIAGTTAGIEFVSGTVALEWISEPLSADFTVAGTITGNLWGLESTMNDNTAINFVVDKIDGATGAITQIAKSARTTELGTTNAANNFTVTPTSTVCKRGDRIRIRPFIDDAGAAMIVGTTTFSYNGPTAAAAGDSYVTFTETLAFEPDPGTVVLEQPDDSGAGVTVGRTTSNQQVAQPFVASTTSLAQVALTLAATNAPADNLIVEIQTDSGGSPSGTVVATVGTVTGASLPFAGTRVVLSVSIALTAAQTYWLVFRRSGALSDTIVFRILNRSNALSGWSSVLQYNGSTWSFADFPITVKFSFLGGPTSTYYLTDTAETINPGSATEKKALTTRGSGSVNAVTNTAAGPTAGAQTTASAGGTAVEWYTPALNAVTFGGKAKFNIRALESNASANASLRAEIAVTATDGTSPVVWGTACVEPGAVNGEVGTSDAALVAWVAGDDTAITAGQRLRFRVYVDDVANGPLVTGFTVTVSYNGTTAAAAGDTYVILPVVVTEQSTGPTTWTGAATVSLSDSRTTAGTRKTFGVIVVSEAIVRQTGGIGLFSSSATVQLTATVTSAGRRVVQAAAAAALTVARTTAGRLTAKGAAGTRQETVAVTTSAVVSGGAATVVGACTVQLVALAAATGTRRTTSTATVALTDQRVTAGTRQTFGTVTRPETVTVTTVGVGAGVKVGAATVQLVDVRTTAGRLSARTGTGVRLETVTVTTAGTGAGVKLGAATVQLAATFTTAGARVRYGQVAVLETVTVTSAGDTVLVASATLPLRVTVTTSATSLVPLPPGRILQPTVGTITTTGGGWIDYTDPGGIDHADQGELAGILTGVA